MLDDGQPVVIDFGIAHVPDATRLTQTGLVMGTPGYLAPEVIQGRAASGASDVHSWGTTVAYAATGRQPFGSGNFQTIFFRVLEGQADLDGIPRHLLPYVAAALSVDPQARPAARWLAGRLGMPPLNGAHGMDGLNGASPALPGMAATLMDYPPQPTRLDPAAAPAVAGTRHPRACRPRGLPATGANTVRPRRSRATWPTCCRRWLRRPRRPGVRRARRSRPCRSSRTGSRAGSVCSAWRRASPR